MNIYLSTSWKNRVRVRVMAIKLREAGHEVYDFTDPKCRGASAEIPPENYPDNFDPEEHVYREYLQSVPEWKAAVFGNRRAIEKCDVVLLMLPCGNDAHADAFYGYGLGKYLIVCGQPRKDERTTTHLWAQKFLDDDSEAPDFLNKLDLSIPRTGDVVLHRQTGETWLVAYGKKHIEGGGHVAPVGWPFCEVSAAECVVKRRASDEECVKLLHEMANMKGHEAQSDLRYRYARNALGMTP